MIKGDRMTKVTIKRTIVAAVIQQLSAAVTALLLKRGLVTQVDLQLLFYTTESDEGFPHRLTWM